MTPPSLTLFLHHERTNSFVATREMPAMTKSGFRGVSYDTKAKRWRAELGNRRNGSLWRSPWRHTADSAARDYDHEARKRYGARAHLNFPSETEVLRGNGKCKPIRRGGVEAARLPLIEVIKWVGILPALMTPGQVKQTEENERQAREARATDAVFAAASARGLTFDQIGFAAGVSRQRAQQRVERYEAKYGRVERGRQLLNVNTSKQPWRCKVCGKLQWRNHKRFGYATCSPACYAARVADFSASFTKISEDMVEHAIDLRRQGRSWSSVARELGHPIQTIQTRIWKYLYCRGTLTLDVVETIWLRRDNSGASWDWIERNTGLICTKTGARLDKPTYSGRRNAWGSVIASTGSRSPIKFFEP